MSLAIISEPPRWVAGYLPAPFLFNHILEVDPVLDIFYRNSVANHQGFFAIANTELALALEDRFYIGREDQNTLYQQTPVQVTELIVVETVPYAVIDVVYADGIPALCCYNFDKIESKQPRFLLYVNDKPLSYLSAKILPENRLEVDPCFYLKRTFEKIHPPLSGIDANLYRQFHITYGVGLNMIATSKHFCSAAIIQHSNPPCSDTAPRWINTNVFRCQKNSSGTNTGIQERQQKDNNPNSATFGQFQWVINGQNLADCPLTVYQNTERSAEFTRNNCQQLAVPSTVTYTVPAGVAEFNSYTSVDAPGDPTSANAKRDAVFMQRGQLYANQVGTCSIVTPDLVSMYKAQFATQEIPTTDPFGNPTTYQQNVVRMWVQRQSGTAQFNLRLAIYSAANVGAQVIESLSWFVAIPANSEYGRITEVFPVDLGLPSNYYIGIKQVDSHGVDIGNQFQAINPAPNNTLEDIPI